MAFIDMGTNSIRLQVVRFQGGGSFSVVAQEKETVRLGEGEFAGKRLQPEAMERAALVCVRFARMARALGAEEIVAVATSACREARNRKEFIARLRREADLDVHIISGKEEARLIYLGVSSAMSLGEQQALFIDIGGGSTEIISGDRDSYRNLDSLKLGAIRLTAQFFAAGDEGPVSRAQYRRIQRHVRSTAVRALEPMKKQGLQTAIGSSGTISALADVAARKFRGREMERDEVMSRSELREVVEMLCGMTLGQRREVAGLNPARADIIIAGAAILETILDELKLKEVRVSDRSLRDGLVIDYLARLGGNGKNGGSRISRRSALRQRSVLQLARSCQFDEAHGRHVAALALMLFDSARGIGLQGAEEDDRELLEHAGMLHDVGTFVSYSNHAAHSHYLIRNAELLGFDQDEIEVIAATARFHQRQLPKRKDPEFAALPAGAQKRVRALATFLRFAEALDRGHRGVIQQARLSRRDDGGVALQLRIENDAELELWGVQGHFRGFEKTFDQPISLLTKPGARKPEQASDVLPGTTSAG